MFSTVWRVAAGIGVTLLLAWTVHVLFGRLDAFVLVSLCCLVYPVLLGTLFGSDARWVKQGWTIRAPGDRFVAATNLLLLVFLAVAALVFRSGPEWASSHWVRILGVLLALAGGSLLFVAKSENPAFSPRVDFVGTSPSDLTEAGAYSVVRHPGYLGMLLAWSGLALSCSPVLLVFVAVYLFLVVTRIRSEEGRLRAAVPQYEGYANSVRYRLIPGIW